MLKEYLALASVLASAADWADVKSASADMAIDGRLDEPCWKAADWNGGFQEVAGRKRGGEADLTSFAIVADARAVYLGVRCKEPELAKIKALPADNIWNCDGFEIFLAPTGKSFSFYHFVVPQNPINGTATLFASEGGNIHPDPYGAPWKVARTEGTDEWTAEIEIPFASFYMTRNEEWGTTWLVNIARTRRAKDYQWTTWSPLEKGFLEPERFRAVKGFPKRAAADDVAMTDVTSEIAARSDGRLTGQLRVKAFALVSGDYTLGCSSGTTAKVSLKTGWNKVSVPCAYPANGRYRTELTLTRDATGAAYSRTFPVLVDFDEIRVKLTTPQYRDNFYPGQDTSKIVGSVKTAGAGAVKLTLEGPGIPRAEKTLTAAGDFAFETPGFDFGTATLTVDFGGVTKRVPIRKLVKTGRQMSWIENGHLVVDGKPVFRRNLYGWRYMAGRAFDARIDADKDLFLTSEIVQGSSLEPFRVIKDLEMREAKRDIVPCKEYFEKVTRMIESQKDRDFTCWYISDEPECRGVSPIYLRHIYEFMKKNDPYHVILTSSRAGLTYVDCADWFETHPYPNPSTDAKGERRYGTPINTIGSFVDAYEPEKHPDKCVGTVPQLFSYKFQSLSNEYPTFDEYNSHVWAGLLRGAKSINPFIYTDMGDRPALYEGNRFVFSSIARLEDLLLDAKRTTLLKTDEAECVRWDLPSGDGMFAVVNFTGAEKTVAIKGLDGDYKPFRSKLKGFGRVAPNGQDARSPGVEVELKPFGVVIGTRKTRDAGLPTYDETVALVARQEYERSHRDNQFLEKYDELAGHWTSSFKLIDGVRDVRAWGNRWEKSHDFDFAFLDRPIRFSKVRLYGTEVAAVRVSVRRNGEWRQLTPKSERHEGLMTELDFGAEHKTVKLRVTAVHAGPGKDQMEVYEIEVPRVAGDEASAVRRAAKAESPVESLWSFNASNATWSAGFSGRDWFGFKTTNVTPRADGGLVVSGHAVRSARFDPAYPWIELEIDGFARNEKPDESCYHAWGFCWNDRAVLANGVTYPQKGLYTLQLGAFEQPFGNYIRFYDHNFDIGIRRLRNVKRPPNCLSATCKDPVVAPGSEIEIVLDLVEPCEEVSTELCIDHGHGGGSERYLLNGSSKIELQATDGTRRHWAAHVPVKSCADAGARAVVVKSTVLCGGLDLPILTNFVQPFKAK